MTKVWTLSLAALLLGSAVQAQSPVPAPAIPMPRVDPAAGPAADAGGTGPYKAVMEAAPGLATQTIYHPRDLSRWGPKKRLPILVWGNGACVNVGNRFRYLLTELASHGYFAVAIGPIGPAILEGPEPIPAPPAPTGGGPLPVPTHWKQMIEAMDWATAQEANPRSPWFHKLDTRKIAVMGQSCGRLQALRASVDPRTTTSVILNSGTFPDGRLAGVGADAPRAGLQQLHAPIAFISGDEGDIAWANANSDFAAINQIPAFRGWAHGIGHTATYRQANAGLFGRVVTQWLDWQLKGSAASARWFKGADCVLCKDPQWVVARKKID